MNFASAAGAVFNSGNNLNLFSFSLPTSSSIFISSRSASAISILYSTLSLSMSSTSILGVTTTNGSVSLSTKVIGKALVFLNSCFLGNLPVTSVSQVAAAKTV